MVFQKSLHSCAMDESSLSIGRVKNYRNKRLGMDTSKNEIVW